MKNFSKLVGIIALAALIVVGMTGCSSDGGDGEPPPGTWTGTYKGGAPRYATVTLGADGAISRGNWEAYPGEWTSYSIEDGGTFAGTGEYASVTGDWVYVEINGSRHGVILYCGNPVFEGKKYLICLGYGWSIERGKMGGSVTFDPEPTASTFPTQWEYAGKK